MPVPSGFAYALHRWRWGIKHPKEKFKFVNLLTENAKYEIVITINAIYERVSILLGSQWLGGREADI